MLKLITQLNLFNTWQMCRWFHWKVCSFKPYIFKVKFPDDCIQFSGTFLGPRPLFKTFPCPEIASCKFKDFLGLYDPCKQQIAGYPVSASWSKPWKLYFVTVTCGISLTVLQNLAQFPAGDCSLYTSNCWRFSACSKSVKIMHHDTTSAAVTPARPELDSKQVTFRSVVQTKWSSKLQLDSILCAALQGSFYKPRDTAGYHGLT